MAGSTESNKRMGDMVNKVSPTACPKGYMRDANGDCKRMSIDPGHDIPIDRSGFGPSGNDPTHEIPFDPSGIDPHFNAGPPDIIKKTNKDQPISFEEYMGIENKKRRTTKTTGINKPLTKTTFEEFMAQKNKP